MQLPPEDRRKATYAFLRGDTPLCPPAGRVRQLPPWNPFDGLQRAPLHAKLVSRSYITHNKAISTFPEWMAAAAQAFSKWIEYWVAQDFPTFRAQTREVSAQSWATIRGTMVRDSDDHDETWLKVFVGHRAVGSITDWPHGALPVFQQPLCSLPVLAVVLDVGELWLYDRQVRRVVPLAEGLKCMAVLVGSKHLARIQGDDAPGDPRGIL